MNDIDALHADLSRAAEHGGEAAGEAAVHAGVAHNDNAARALLNIQTVNTQFYDPLHARVIASQPAGITDVGPVLPNLAGTADLMADVATDAAVANTLGRGR